jgi:hypothetical protein
MAHRFRTLVSPKLLVAVITASLVLQAALLMASSGGKTGVSASANGCNCHSSSRNASGTATVSISGPQNVAPGSVHDYTISVTGGPSGTTGGFNLSADGGTFTAGTGCRVSSGEMTHSNNSRRSWTFQWTAPATNGTYKFVAVAQATNGSGSSGDSWNWYGGAAGAAFPITVDSSTPTLRASWGALKSRYRK